MSPPPRRRARLPLTTACFTVGCVWLAGCGAPPAGAPAGADARGTRGTAREASPSDAPQPPPADTAWPTDYAAARARARAERRHLCVLVEPPGTDASPEAGGLADPLVRRALADTVRVRSTATPELAEALGPVTVPTLAFQNPLTGAVDHRVDAIASGERLAREIVHARRAMGVPLSAELEAVAARMFSLDPARFEELLAAGDAAGVAALLAPAAGDDSRRANYLVARVAVADGVSADDVRFLAGRDCVVGGFGEAGSEPPAFIANRLPDLVASCTGYALPDSGLVVAELDPAGDPHQVRITAPGCRLVDDVIRFEGAFPGTAVQLRHYEIRPLEAGEAARLTGRVLRPDGGPAAGAIVRVADASLPAPEKDAAMPLAVTARSGADGGFALAGLSPGRFLVRAEFPGGECERFVELAPDGETACELPLAAAATVSLRWAVQTRPFSQDLAGDGVREDEATFSVASSRMTLAGGMRVRTADCSDIMLAATPLGDDDLPAATLAALAGLPAGWPVWYLRDAAYTRDFTPLSGLHRDARAFDEIRTVRDGEPLPEQDWEIIGDVLPAAVAAARDAGSFFQILRGDPVRKGDVFVLRCVALNCFAKIEVTDVTVPAALPPAAPPPATPPPATPPPATVPPAAAGAPAAVDDGPLMSASRSRP